MNIFKSVLVLFLLLVLTLLIVFFAVNCIRAWRNKDLTWRLVLLLLCSICITVPCFAFFGGYVYPFERTLNPKLVAEFEVTEKYELDYPGQEFWRGAYEAYGLWGQSLWFDPDDVFESKYGFGWPPMDFDRYSYIITYGQKIESLSYNVWDTIDVPFRTGAKAGHMILDEAFSPEKVYVYQIPKLRIDNDVNDPDNPWD